MSTGKGPQSSASIKDDQKHAADLVRQKIEQIYSDEPDAKEEIAEVKAVDHSKSKHQKFMNDLSSSGKSLAEIQTAWHNYYVELPDDEKKEVWQEFYAEHSHNHGGKNQAVPAKQPAPNPKPEHKNTPKQSSKSVAEAKKQIIRKVSSRSAKLNKNAHFKSALFGIGIGGFVMIIFLFGFFNERFIAPFITPSKSVSSTPIIIDPSSTAVGPEPKVIIPKINVEIPVVYDEPSIEEKAIQAALERGVVHYATTPLPGEIGNPVIFGHSSNNILNKGQYKFAFVLLNRLEIGDTFMLQKDGKRYIYKVSEKKVVKPNDVSILTSSTAESTATLITCDPPGTSINRLLVTGQQISPDPAKNVASTVTPSDATPETIPGNAPSLWQRIKSWFTS